MAMVDYNRRSRSIFHHLIPKRFRSRKRKKKYQDASTGEETVMVDQENMTKDNFMTEADLIDPRNTTIKSERHEKCNCITINASNTVNLTFNLCSDDLGPMQNILLNVQSKEFISEEESPVGKLGNTKIALIDTTDSSEEEEGTYDDKKSCHLKDREEEDKKLEEDIKCVRHQIKPYIRLENQHCDKVDSSNSSDCSPNDDGNQDECKTFNASNNGGPQYWNGQNTEPSGPIESFSKQGKCNDLNHSSMSPWERNTVPVDDLNQEREEMTADTILKPSNTESHMNWSTFDNDISNVKHYTGNPELEEPTGRNHVMELLDTMPKATENSIELQKDVEHSPIPDPVPTHEETQPKLSRDTSDRKTNFVSYEISSGYPAHSDSSRTGKTLSDSSKAAFETELSASYENECNSAFGRSINVAFDTDVQVSAHSGLQSQEVNEILPDQCQKSSDVVPFDCAAQSECETHHRDIDMNTGKTESSTKHTEKSEPTNIRRCLETCTDKLVEISETESSDVNLNVRSTTPVCSKTGVVEDYQQSNRIEVLEAFNAAEQFQGNTVVVFDGFDSATTHTEMEHPDKTDGKAVDMDQGNTRMAPEGQYQEDNVSLLSGSSTQDNDAFSNTMLEVSENELESHEMKDSCPDKCSRSSDVITHDCAAQSGCAIQREICMNAAKVETLGENKSKVESSNGHDETTNLDPCGSIEMNSTGSYDAILNVRNIISEMSQSQVEKEDCQQSNMAETIEASKSRVSSHENHDTVDDTALRTSYTRCEIIFQNEHGDKADDDCDVPMGEDTTSILAAEGQDHADNCQVISFVERSTLPDENACDTYVHALPHNGSLEDICTEECAIQSPTVSTLDCAVHRKGDVHKEIRMNRSSVENIRAENAGGCDEMNIEQCEEVGAGTYKVTEMDSPDRNNSNLNVRSIQPEISQTNEEERDFIQSVQDNQMKGDIVDSKHVRGQFNWKKCKLSKQTRRKKRVINAELKSLRKNLPMHKCPLTGRRMSTSKCELFSCSSIENGAGSLSCDSFLSSCSFEQETNVKLREKRKKRKVGLRKNDHNESRNKLVTKWNVKRENPSSTTIEKKLVRSSLLQHRCTDLESEWKFAESVISDRFDSGAFFSFASQYTSSYGNIKQSLRSHQSTSCKRIHIPGRTSSRKEDLLEELRRVLDIEEFRIQEKQLRSSLRRITSSWSYFTPESFIPLQYPGVLQSFFERLQSGEQLSLQERYSYEWIRFQSFDQYAGNGSGIVLARNGFYHDSENGTTATRCYACDATYSEWEFFDEVEARHNPGCPHVHEAGPENIPIQPEADHDLQFSARRPDHSSSDGDSREVNLAVTSERDTGNEDEATPARVTEAPGAQSNPPSVDMVATSMQQASISSQPTQPTQDRENEQFMSSYVAHRDDGAHLAVTSQDTHTSSPAAQSYQHSQAQSNRDTGPSLPYGSSDSPRLIRFGAGRQSGSEHQPQPSTFGQPSAYSLPTPSSQAPISGQATSSQSSTAGHNTTYTSSQPLSDSSSSSSQPSSTESSQSQSATSTQSQATISNPSSTSAQLVTSSQPSTPSQPVTVSEDSAASQLALSGAPIASSLNETRALQASGGRQLETPGHIQTHPELILLDSPKHPEYGSVDARANTFRGTWPSTLDQTPRRMAEAGFYYTGVADFTRCYACGGGLRNWEAGDDPVIEHTRWYPTCPYVTKLKGEKYVQAVIVKQQQHLEEKRKEQVALSQQRAAQRAPPDPLRSTAAAVLSEMGYSQDRIKDAILAVRQQTGSTEVTAEQALIWILDDDERRSAIAARRAAGSSAFFSSSQASSTSATSSSTSSSTSATATASRSSSSSSQSSAGTQQPAETGIKQPSTSTAGNQQSTETGIKQSASAGSQPPAASGSEQQGGAGSQPSSGSGGERSSLEAAGNQQGATGGAEDTKKSEGSQSSGGKSKRKKRNKKGGQSASLPAEGATGSSRNSPPNTAEGATGNSGDLPPNTDTQSLRVENEKLRDIQTCKICLDKPVDTTFLPCGHLVCCGRCANKMRKCPICRKPIRGSVKTFMS